MRKYFYSIFNLEDNEGLSVFLFLTQSIFLGIFYGAFDVGAHALFLTVYPASMIPKAYIVSGIAGIILTSLYARIQNRLPFSKLAILNLIFISISTAILRLLFQFTESNWLIFLIFIMMGPLNIIALLGFWGAVGRIFSLRQGKRLFGLIDSGQIFGAILSTFAIPVLVAVGFQQKNLLFLSSVSIVGALIMQLIISVKFNLNQVISKATKKQKRLPVLLKNKYILFMSVFVVMSMFTAFFIQYSFLSVTKENYPDHNDLTEFLGAFTGSLLLFTFLFKTFLYSKLMKAYGLKISMIISPFLLGIFTLLAVGIGSLWGYTSASASFIFFFLIISLSRLFSKALKDGVEYPSFKILYQSLKVDIRHDVQAYVDGTINEIAALASGLLLAVLGLFEFFTLIHFSYALLIILVIWFFIARKLYFEYKTTLQESLAEFKVKEESVNDFSEYITDNLCNDLSKDPKFITGIEFNSKIHPLEFEQNIDQLISHSNSQIEEYAISKVSDLKLIEKYININSLKEVHIENENLKEVIHRAQKTIETPGNTELIKLSKARSTDERVLAAFLIGKFYNKELFVYLKALIRDNQSTVKIATIRSATKLQLESLCPYIIDYLDSEDIYSYAYDSILLFKQKALSYLDLVFYKSGTNHRVLLRIVKLIAEIGGNEAKELLVKKLDHPNEEILNFILLGLQKCNFEADENNINQVHQIIEKHIGLIGWNIAAKQTLSEYDIFEELETAFNEEITANFEMLYLLLSLAYDAQSVLHVKENIESGTSEGASYALELLDLFVSEEIKPKLFPVVEDISLLEKIRLLQDFYPIKKLEIEELLLDTINRDINFISLWTKACAIKAIKNLKNSKVTDDLVAHLFNPNQLLRQSAAVVIYELDKENYYSIEKRLSDTYKEELEDTLDEREGSENHLLFEKTQFLKSIEHFENVPSKYLFLLADVMTEYKTEDENFSFYNDLELNDKLLLIKGDSVSLKDESASTLLLPNKLYVIDDLKVKSNHFTFENTMNSTVYLIDKKDLMYNVFDYYEIEVCVLKWFSNELQAEHI
ncbi:MAG: hypothetical protein JEY96_03360 [Bacteroidales bacterium]|nr:hypothetical protein [Bacteroidales bacterium]